LIKLIKIELYKIFKKWRTYIGFLAISVLIPVIQIAMLVEGEKSLDFMTRNLQQSFIFVGNLLNGYLITYLILGSLYIHIPFLITLVAGDLMAGEATAGTYRLLITRPVSRFKLVTSKFAAGLLYTLSLIFWLALISLGLGILIFGFGELIVIKSSQIIIFAKDDVFWRFLLAFSFAFLSMSVVASLAFLFSSLVENAIGPIISTMAVIITFIVISAIEINIFQDVKPYLFTTYMSTWRLFFDDTINYSEIIKSCLILSGHILVFFGTAAIIFKRKDILS
jgi:ABC-2 type transport system permease protein